MTKKKSGTIPLKKLIGKYIPENHEEYVELLAKAPVKEQEEYVEVDSSYIACIKKPTKKMIDRVIYKSAKTHFHLVAKYADAAQQLEAVKANPANLAHIALKPTQKVIDAAFKRGGEWIKTAPPVVYGEAVQIAAVRANSQLIRWFIKPKRKALELAIELDSSLKWMARLYIK